jgi:hypothetical protein
MEIKEYLKTLQTDHLQFDCCYCVNPLKALKALSGCFFLNEVFYQNEIPTLQDFESM